MFATFLTVAAPSSTDTHMQQNMSWCLNESVSPGNNALCKNACQLRNTLLYVCAWKRVRHCSVQFCTWISTRRRRVWSLNYLALNISRFEIICSDSQHLPLLKLGDMQIFNQMFRFVFMFSWGSIFKWSLQKKKIVGKDVNTRPYIQRNM